MTTSPTRWLAALMCLGVLSVLAAACGDEDDDGSSGDLSGEQLTFVTYGGTTGEAYEPAYLDNMSADTGLEIVPDAPTDFAKLQTQVESGNVSWDIVGSDTFFTTAECGTLLEPLPDSVDRSKIDPAYVTDDCGVASYVYANMFVYDKTEFRDDPPTSWADFFDTEKYPGPRGMGISPTLNTLEHALLADGVAPEDLYPIDYDRAFAKLDTIRDDVVFYDTLAQGVEQLIAGDVVMQQTANGRALAAVNAAEVPYAPVWNGAMLSFESLGLVKDHPASSEATAAVLNDVATNEQGQRTFAAITGYGPTIEGVAEQLPASVKPWLPTLEKNSEQAVVVDNAWWAENYEEYIERLNTWLAG